MPQLRPGAAKKIKNEKKRKQSDGCRGLGEREEGTKPVIGTEFQLWKMEKVLAMDGGEGFQQ